MRLCFLAFAFVTVVFGQVASAQQLVGKVNGGGGPIAKSTVTLWAAGQGAPTKLSATSTGDDGAFRIQVDTQKASGGVLYLTATGGEPKILSDEDPRRNRFNALWRQRLCGVLRVGETREDTGGRQPSTTLVSGDAAACRPEAADSESYLAGVYQMGEV